MGILGTGPLTSLPTKNPEDLYFGVQFEYGGLVQLLPGGFGHGNLRAYKLKGGSDWKGLGSSRGVPTFRPQNLKPTT